MSDQDPPRLSDLGDDGDDFLRDAIRESKRDLPDETRLAAIALKLGPGILGGAAAAGGAGGGGAAAGGAGAVKASAAPAAAKIGAMSVSMKFATAVAVTVAIGGGAVVVPKIISPTTSAVTVAATTNSTSSAIASSSAINLALPPASASAAPLPTMKPLVIPPRSQDEEVKALDDERAALNTDPEYALAQCDDDAKLFPRGTFAQEREVTAIDALKRLGRMPEAKARAKKFATDYPGSAQLQRVQQLVGQK
jgi:hypothetical protein